MRLRMILVMLPVIMPLWLGIAAFLNQKYHSVLAGAARDSRNLAYAFEENTQRAIEAIDTTLRAARTARAADPGHFNLAAWQQDIGPVLNQAIRLFIVDRQGNLLTNGRQVNIADRPYFQAIRQQIDDTLYIGQPIVSRLSERWVVQLIRRITDANGNFDGLVIASLDPDFLSHFYHSLDISRGALMLVGTDGVVRAAAPNDIATIGADLSRKRLFTAATADFGTLRSHDTQDGIDRIYSWRRVHPYDLLVFVGMSTGDALTSYRRDLRGAVSIGIAATILAMLAGVLLDRHRRAVERSGEVLRAALENISQGLMVVDAARRVPVLNARAAELLGLPPHLMRPGISFDDLLNWQMESGEFGSAETVAALVRQGGIEQGDSVYSRQRRNGTVLEIRTKTLNTGLAVRTYTDITEQERTASILAEARDAAEAAARARSEFLAVMSHEIRTPLNGVIGLAGLLEDMQLGPAQREYIRLIRESGDHLLELINDILDFSRLEASRVQLEEATFDPRTLVSAAVGMFRSQAGTKGLDLSATVQESVPQAVIGDPGRLRQVLINLLSNAIKFTDHGWVRVTLMHQQFDSDPATVRLLFSVADSGIGIAPSAIERMFAEFTQADGSISRRFGGSGLGLAISRRLVELMGGNITVESQPAAGSLFRFAVTLGRADATAEAEASVTIPTAAERRLRVLVAEDNPTNRLVALRLMERLGHNADAVENGAEAITELATNHYDLLLVDVMMPEIDGLTATRCIRSSEPPGTHLAIVGLTASSGTEALEACIAAGMDSVTTKPVTLARLRAAIAEGLANAGVVMQSAEAPPPMSRLRELAQELGEEAVREIAITFAEDAQLHLNVMRHAVDQADSQRIYLAAHSLKGAAQNVGATDLAARAAMLERDSSALGMDRIAAEVAAMQTDLDAVLHSLGIQLDQVA
jgi:signal transduction histidine kinase/DNA-binding response OmpR family regulator